MKLLSRVLILIGLALVAIGHRIEPPPTKPVSEIRLTRRHYRVVSAPPSG